MNDRIDELLQRMQSLREELRQALQEREAALRANIGQRSAEFELQLLALQARIKTHWLRYVIESELRHLISAPIIYSMIIPFVLLDICLFLYQTLCFPLYRLPKVKRRDYISIDRARLPYLNVIEKVNCLYCGYGNGLIAYAGEIAARTEQYWCPIKHAEKMLDTHHRFEKFAEFGNAQEFDDKAKILRESLRKEDDNLV